MVKNFDVKATNICKGIAIIWMMYHHLVPYTEFSSGPVFLSVYLPGILGLTGKVCVSIFLVLSGYGLYKSGGGGIKPLYFYSKRLKKIYLTYWLIFNIFTIIGIFLFRDAFIYLTNNPFSRSENLFYSLTGFQYFIRNSGYMGYNAAWWYIGLCIILYILYPILQFILSKSPSFFYGITVFIYCFCWSLNNIQSVLLVGILRYLPAFAIGMILAHVGFFEKMNASTSNHIRWKEIAIAVLIVFFVLIKYLLLNYSILGFKLDCIISFFLVWEVYFLYCSYENNMCIKILAILGKYSFEIYLIHLFITNMYTTMYIYSINDAFWMVVVTLCISMFFAVPIQRVTSLLIRRKNLLDISLVALFIMGAFLSYYAGKL